MSPIFGILVHSDILIPTSDGCPENTRGCEEFSCPKTCYCSDHCSWERCTVSPPPETCLHGTDAMWHWDYPWWSAKHAGKHRMTLINYDRPKMEYILFAYLIIAMGLIVIYSFQKTKMYRQQKINIQKSQAAKKNRKLWRKAQKE